MTNPLKDTLRLPSGPAIAEPAQRLLRFCIEEYAYYDGIPAGDPDRVSPVDVLATVSVNSFVNSAERVRTVHRGLSVRCDPLLRAIPTGTDLLDSDPPLEAVQQLLHGAVQTPQVLLPVATKVLHRKRPALIPMLDNVLVGHYLRALGQASVWAKSQDKRHAASVGITVLGAFRADLAAVHTVLHAIREALAESGYSLTLVRLLEILVWSEVEGRGYYRTAPPPARLDD